MLKKSIVTTVLILLFSVGCSTRYPLDIPEEKWKTMSEAQQLQARQKQAELDRAREKRRAAEARAREAEAIKWLKAKEAARENASYGERVQCVLTDAQAYLWGKWRDIEPVALDLVKGMVLEFEIIESADNGIGYQEKGYAGFDGQTLSLCSEKDRVQRNSATCARVLGTFEQYAKGLQKRIRSDEFLRGKIRCDLAPGKGMPKRLIIDDR